MTISRDRLGLAALAFLLAPPTIAIAQDTPDAHTDNQILVTGKLQQGLTDKEKRAIAHRFARRLTLIQDDDAIALYDKGRYCPAVIGMGDAIDGAIEQRMRAVAAAAGVEPATGDCSPDALVMLVDDKASFLKAFRKAQPVYFQGLKDRYFKLPKEDGPAIAWKLSQAVDENGAPLKADENGVRYVVSTGTGSMISPIVRTAIAMSVLVVERSALEGFTTRRVADYAVMRSLTDAQPDKMEDGKAETILTLLSTPTGAEAPASVTAWDFDYLKARYNLRPFTYSRTANDRIGSELEKTAGNHLP